MRTRTGSWRRCEYRDRLLAGALVLVSCSTAATQVQKQQQIILPDPTPRQTDPSLRFPDDTEGKAHLQEAIKTENAKRRALVEWAANELVLLSERLEADVSKPKSTASMTTATANAAKIEELAKNLKAALAAH